MAPTEAQLKLMEENKKRAMEKRALASATRQILQTGPNNNVFVQQSKSQSIRPTSNSFQSPQPTTSSGYKNVRPNFQKQTSPNGFYGKSQTNASPSVVKNRPVASFSLISRSRFTVDSSYDAEMVEIYKKVPGKSYDPQTQRWSFPLSGNKINYNIINL